MQLPEHVQRYIETSTYPDGQDRIQFLSTLAENNPAQAHAAIQYAYKHDGSLSPDEMILFEKLQYGMRLSRVKQSATD